MREKQIEEMTEAIFHNCNCGLFFLAEGIFQQG